MAVQLKRGPHIGILLICVVVGVVIVAWMKFFNISNEKTIAQPTHQGSYSSPIITPIPTPYGYTGARPTPYPDQYGLMNAENVQVKVSYKKVGTVHEGQFKDYQLILATAEPETPGGPLAYLFATLDYKHFYLNGDREWMGPLDRDDDADNFYYILNKDKIVGVVDLLSAEFPETIPLDNFNSLYRGDPFDYSGHFSGLTPLSSPVSTLKLYAMPGRNVGDAATYVKESTGIIAINNSGLPVHYELATNVNIEQYKKGLPAFRSAYLTAAKTNNWSNFHYLSTPNMRILGKDISSTVSLYDHYDVALPGGCGGGVSTAVLKNISETDLVSLGWTNGKEYFQLASSTHPLLTAQYDSKFFDGDATKPTLAQYEKKIPLIFLKDNWGRWIALGEYDYLLPGGCGKPVVYLYPEKETAVSVSFVSPMRLDVQIPNYKNGWKVLASPNGQLKDLQPEATRCSQFDGLTHGQEYAKQACAAGVYPYIYWAGRSSNAYTTPINGWLVARDNVAKFLDDQLQLVGLNAKERADMAEYWVPVLMAKDAPYYRIAFLQTSELNALAPMQVTPNPDTVIRIFLDWEPLTTKPLVDLLPQHLTHYGRNGFTLVEWGGLKR